MLKKAPSSPLILVGAGALARQTARRCWRWPPRSRRRSALKDGWNGFAVLHTAARASARSISASCRARAAQLAQMTSSGTLDVLFLLGADEIEDAAEGAFVVYIGTHGDRGAHRADVILPGAAYTEKSGIYVNTEGRVQMPAAPAFPPGEAREDWAILRALSDVLGKKLPYDSLAGLRQALFKAHPHLLRIDQIEPPAMPATSTLAGWAASSTRRRSVRRSRISI